MILKKCILTKNECYKSGRKMTIKGIMVHSTGANNPNLRRYVQPNDGLLGVNNNGNHWNRGGLEVCVHAFIGKLNDGTVATYQTLPWDSRGWHAGSGKKGSANNGYISFEICEDNLANKAYFNSAYKEASELCAYLCELYNLNPLKDGVLICHSEGATRGIASSHADVMHWFPKHGKNMDVFRRDVYDLLHTKQIEEKPKVPIETVPKKDKMEDDIVTQEQFNEFMNTYLANLNKQPPSDWSKDAREWAESNEIIHGNENGEKQYKAFCTREQMVQFLHRVSKL